MYKFVFNYKNNDRLRLSFNHLAQDTFSIDFEKWYQLQAWDDNYIPFSFLDETDNVIANVSASIQTLLIDGSPYKSIQIGTVMTHPEHRRKGLAFNLMQKCLKYFKDKTDFIFLFPDENAIPLYQKCGFELYHDYLFSYNYKNTNVLDSLIKLNPDNQNDMILIKKVLKDNNSHSKIFSVDNDLFIILWHLIYHLNQNIYYSEQHNALIICKKDNNILKIYAYFSQKNSLSAFLEVVNNFSFESLLFLFTPAFINSELLVYHENEPIMICSDNQILPRLFCFPFTSRA